MPHYRFSSISLAVALAVGTVVFNPAAQAQAVAPIVSFSVPAQPLDTALNELARQAGLQLMVGPHHVAGRKAPAIEGSMTARQALERALAGSGLAADIQGERVIVRPVSELRGDAATLAPVLVRAEYDGVTEGTGSYAQPGPSDTATPLGLTLKETPQSVSVITRQRLDDQGLTSVEQTLAQTPGVSISAMGTEKVGAYARGYPIANYQLDGVSTHTVFDSMAEASPQLATDMAVYDRVEVLRGASGLMTGAGEPSGSVNLVRKRPTHEFQGSAEGALGSWRAKRGQLDLSGPFNEAGSVRGRFVAAWQHGDSFIDDYERDKRQLYGILEADLTDTTRVSAGVEYQRTRSKAQLAMYGGGVPLWFSDGQTTDLPRSFNSSGKNNRFESDSTTAFVSLEQALGREWSLKLDANHVRSSQHERSVELSLADAFPEPGTGDGMMLYAGARKFNVRVSSLSANVKGPINLFGRRHELAFGADYSNYRARMDGSFDDALDGLPANLYTWDRSAWGNPGETFVEVETTRRQTSVYGVGRFSLGERLKLIVGSKVFNAKSDRVTQNATGYYYGNPTSEKNVWTPYGGLVFDLNDSHSAYASYTTIYRPQSVQDRFGNMLDPVEGANYEIGFKSNWLDGRLGSAIALYQIRQDNLAEADGDHLIPGGTSFRDQAYRAIKGATTKGVDIELTGALTERWNLSLSWAYSQTKKPGGEAMTTTFPRHMVKLWTTYRFSGAWSGLTVGGGVNWQSKTWLTAEPWFIDGKVRWEQKPFAVVGLMARYDFNERLSATLNVNNLFDKKYYVSVTDWAYSGMYGAPRSMQLNVRYSF